VPPSGIVKIVNVSKQSNFNLSPCVPLLAPDELRLQGLEGDLGDGFFVAIAIGAHRDQEAALLAEFPIPVRAILTAPIGLVDASRRWLTQDNGHLQTSDRQTPLQAVADSPADAAPGIEVQNDGQVEPAVAGPATICSIGVPATTHPFPLLAQTTD
jgi:hypothetical protein